MCYNTSMKTYIVYQHTSPSQKRYIGITSQEPQKRWKNGLGYCNNPLFYNAIKKYGWDSFIHEILYSGLTEEEACRIEEQLIAQYKSYDKQYGYNVALGGEANRPTKQTKGKICDAITAKWQDEEYKQETSEKMRGLKRSEVARANISKAQRKRFENPEERKKISDRQIGSKRSEIAKQKTSEALKRYYSDEKNLEKLRKVRAEVNRIIRGRKVLCVETGVVYETITDAATATCITRGNISYACNGKRQTAGGYHWSYV